MSGIFVDYIHDDSKSILWTNWSLANISGERLSYTLGVVSPDENQSRAVCASIIYLTSFPRFILTDLQFIVPVFSASLARCIVDRIGIQCGIFTFSCAGASRVMRTLPRRSRGSAEPRWRMSRTELLSICCHRNRSMLVLSIGQRIYRIIIRLLKAIHTREVAVNTDRVVVLKRCGETKASTYHHWPIILSRQ